MRQLPEAARPAPGLRERKKAKTKTAIQQHAVRLFRDQGYDETTVEQVAEAAEVSPSTVFRYFPTKEDLVVSDDYDPLIVAAIEAQLPGLTPLQAVRGGLRAAFEQLSSRELVDQRDRILLVFTAPQLRAASLGNLTTAIQLIAETVAKRTGRESDDPAVRAFAGATVGVMLTVIFDWAKDPDMDAPAAIDDALARLGAGLPL